MIKYVGGSTKTPLTLIGISGAVICAAGGAAAASIGDHVERNNGGQQPGASRAYFPQQTLVADGVSTWQVRSVSVNDDLVDYRATFALGAKGIDRLRRFMSLPEGWDGRAGRPLNNASLDRLSDFFALTSFYAPGMSVFMSSEGNAVVNWERSDGLVEIEFAPDRLNYFIEGRSLEESLEMSASSMWHLRGYL